MNTPAFPSPRWEGWGSPQEGMTLRDYFAAKAMEGLLSGLLADGQDLKWEGIAIDSYRQADAMMKAREQ
jgi:hypothetical protein